MKKRFRRRQGTHLVQPLPDQSRLHVHRPRTGFDGTVVNDTAQGYDLKLITYRNMAQTKSRTQGNYWLKALLPENFLLMNSADADERRLKDGDTVHISSASNLDGEWDFGNGIKRAIASKVKVVEGMRPEVIALALGFGHWAYGAVVISIDGTTIKGDERRFEGFHANAAMRTDPLITNTCLFDPLIVIGTLQTLRVKSAEGRKVYAHHEALEPHFVQFYGAGDGLEKIEEGRQ